jgi:hypothetical protein
VTPPKRTEDCPPPAPITPAAASPVAREVTTPVAPKTSPPKPELDVTTEAIRTAAAKKVEEIEKELEEDLENMKLDENVDPSVSSISPFLRCFNCILHS